ncbi:MAG: YHYH protein [Cyclobacteriaceae bacterium]
MRNYILILAALALSTRLMGQCDPSAIYAVEDANAVCIEIDDTNDNVRMIYANNYPDHDDNYNQPQFDVTADYYEYSVCAYPVEAAATTPLYEETETSVGCTYTYTFGVSINGVKYDPNSAVTFINDDDNDGENDDSNNLDWHVEATSTTNNIGQNMGTDNGGHLNPFGEYHYHAVPTSYFTSDLGIDGSAHSPIVGYAADGFPVYYKYVYSDSEDAESSIVAASSGYSLRSGSRGGDGKTAPDGDYDGSYYEDYEYDETTTILDECNGRYGVTPDFEYGTYYYVLTDEYPYIPRCFKGSELDNTFRVGPSASCGSSQAASSCAAAVYGCMDPFSTNYNPSANADDGSCSYSTETVIWMGSWDNGSGPGESDVAIIKNDYTFSVDGSFSCGDLTVESSAVVTVDNESTLEVNGDLDVSSGSIVVESGSSLITYESNSITGDSFTFKRNTRYADGKYSFVGTPVVQDASITGSDLGSVVYKYNETTPYGNGGAGLDRWEDASADELIPGKGYAQAFQKEIVFNGVPNDGTITHTGTFTDLANSNPEGWNLVANPYTSAISVAGFLAENDNIEGAVYIWDDNNSASVRGSNDDYIIANGTVATNTTPAGGESRYNMHLGSAQGFFVKLSDETDKHITFTEDMRATSKNSDTNYFRKVQNEISYVRINLTDKMGLFKQSILGWMEDVSNTQMDRSFDARVFNTDSEYAVYTLKADRFLAIQGVTYDKEEIYLGFNVAESGNYKLEVDISHFDGDELFILDQMTGEMMDLLAESYTFSSSAGQFTDRFILKPSAKVLAVENGSAGIYAYKKTLHIETSEPQSKTYGLYDLSGQRVFMAVSTGSAVIDLSHIPNGVYLVSDGVETKKIILK